MDCQLEDYKSKCTEYFQLSFSVKTLPNSDDDITRGENYNFIREVTFLFQEQKKNDFRLPSWLSINF